MRAGAASSPSVIAPRPWPGRTAGLPRAAVVRGPAERLGRATETPNRVQNLRCAKGPGPETASRGRPESAAEGAPPECSLRFPRSRIRSRVFSGGPGPRRAPQALAHRKFCTESRRFVARRPLARPVSGRPLAARPRRAAVRACAKGFVVQLFASRVWPRQRRRAKVQLSGSRVYETSCFAREVYRPASERPATPARPPRVASPPPGVFRHRREVTGAMVPAEREETVPRKYMRREKLHIRASPLPLPYTKPEKLHTAARGFGAIRRTRGKTDPGRCSDSGVFASVRCDPAAIR